MVDSNSAKPATGQGNPSGRQGDTRGRSTIGFPYLHLSGCIELAEAVHEIGGTSCEWGQVAAKVGLAAKGGNFRVKMLAARSFGLLEYKSNHVTLTDIGIRALDPMTQKKGRVEAFLNVPLFGQMYKKLQDILLPPPAAIERQMEELGVVSKQTSRARQVFLRSARDAGFFEISGDRLVKPSTAGPVESPGDEHSDDKQDTSDPSDSNQLDGPAVHPLIEALLAQMPPSGTNWDRARCVIWLQTLVLSLGMIYENFDELREIEVRLQTGN